MEVIELLVTKKSNPTVHQMKLAGTTQNQHKTIMEYLILSKATQLKTLKGVEKHTEAFQAALRDQQTLQGSTLVMATRSSYKNQKQQYQQKMQQGH